MMNVDCCPGAPRKKKPRQDERAEQSDLLCTALNAEMKRSKLTEDIRELRHLLHQHGIMSERLKELDSHVLRSYEKSVRTFVQHQKDELRRVLESLPPRELMERQLQAYRDERCRVSRIIQECEAHDDVRRVKRHLDFTPAVL
jgi:hypothetical protein